LALLVVGPRYEDGAMGTDAVRFLVLWMAGWIHSRQLEVIDFLRERTVSSARSAADGAYASPTTSAGRWLSKAGSSAVAGWASSRAWSPLTQSCAGTAS
jgi:hypothetical protein